MACPTCDHTMQCIDASAGSAVKRYWCPRCGTMAALSDKSQTSEAPKLVERCRDFDSVWDDDAVGRMLWRKLGITESIHQKGGE